MPTDKITLKEKPAAAVAGKGAEPSRQSTPRRNFALATIALVLCFGVPIYHLITFAAQNELYSYILLMPLVSWYLIRLKKPGALSHSKPLRGAGVGLGVAGAAVLAGYFVFGRSVLKLEMEDYLAMNILAFLLFLFGAAGIFLGRETLRACAFPLGILVFIIPMPVFLRHAVEIFLQYGSAFAAQGMFQLSGMPFIRDGLVFRLPGVSLQVATECSGIHSSYILLLTSLLAGYLFLRSPWKRGLLALVIIPLSLLRNGFRIFTIGQLCVHIGPHMIDSFIHRKGGPIFFVLSLIPFFCLLAYLHRSERANKKPGSSTSA